MSLQPPMPLPVAPRDKSDSGGDGSSSNNGGDESWKRSPQPPRLLQSYYDGIAEREKRSRGRYEKCFIASMSLVLLCVTGCEHGLATWLSPYGIELGGLSEQRMAFMSSTYWGVMCAGRLLWTGLSGVVSSTWPMLFFDLISCFLSSSLLIAFRLAGASSTLFEPLLWMSSMGLGLGVASGLPCVYSLPPEAQVPMTPWAITILNAASTLGETSFPYVIGLAFGRELFWTLGGLMTCAMGLALAVSLGAWRQSIQVVQDRSLMIHEYEF